MNIEILHMTGGAAQAKGVTVIIDVFRAFSFESWALHNGAEAVYPIADINAAYELHREHPDWLLAGERKGIKQEGFHFGNSPWEIHDLDLTGRSLVHTTSAGTQGLIAAEGASHIFLGALVNAKATAEAQTVLENARKQADMDTQRQKDALKDEFTRLVAEATTRVTGKVLTEADHRTINAEAINSL